MNFWIDKTKRYCNFINKSRPNAIAKIQGSSDFSKINGIVSFYGVNGGFLVVTQINGLPQGEVDKNHRVFAFHIHNGDACTGNEKDPFAGAGTHLNPNNMAHPYHVGDLPPLFSNNGSVWSAFFTDRFTLEEIVGKTVIIHSGVDDFTSQPSGNAGTKIACGVIKKQ